MSSLVACGPGGVKLVTRDAHPGLVDAIAPPGHVLIHDEEVDYGDLLESERTVLSSVRPSVAKKAA